MNPDYPIQLEGRPKDKESITNEEQIGPSVSHDYIVSRKLF